MAIIEGQLLQLVPLQPAQMLPFRAFHRRAALALRPPLDGSRLCFCFFALGATLARVMYAKDAKVPYRALPAVTSSHSLYG